MDFSSDAPGANSWAANASKPAARQTSSFISTMNVLPPASKGYAWTCITPYGVSRM